MNPAHNKSRFQSRDMSRFAIDSPAHYRVGYSSSQEQKCVIFEKAIAASTRQIPYDPLPTEQRERENKAEIEPD